TVTFLIGSIAVSLSTWGGEAKTATDGDPCSIGMTGSDGSRDGYIDSWASDIWWKSRSNYRHGKPGLVPVIISAKLLCKPKPSYTDAAIDNGTTGVVRLRAVLLPSGRIGNITVINSLPDGLTEQAIDASTRIKFEPKTVDGQAVDTHVIIDYSFNLH